MQTKFIITDYLALALIKFKKELLLEDFVTVSEVNQFAYFLQKKFNNQNVDVIITSTISNENFDVFNGVIKISNNCSLNLYYLPANIITILCDVDLINKFLMELLEDKIEMLKTKKVKNLIMKG